MVTKEAQNVRVENADDDAGNRTCHGDGML